MRTYISGRYFLVLLGYYAIIQQSVLRVYSKSVAVNVQSHVLLQRHLSGEDIKTNTTAMLVDATLHVRPIVMHQTLAHEERLLTDVALEWLGPMAWFGVHVFAQAVFQLGL